MKDSEIEYVNTFKNDHQIIYEHDYEEIYVIVEKMKDYCKIYLIDYKNKVNNVFNSQDIFDIKNYIYYDMRLYQKKLYNYFNSYTNQILGINGLGMLIIPLNYYNYITNIEKIIKYDSADIIYICGYKIIIKDDKVLEVIKDDYFINNLLAIAKAAEDIRFSYE